MNLRIKSIDRNWLEAAQQRQNRLTKPPGSLGILEEVGVRLAAIQRTPKPHLGRGAVIVCAADHGVAAEGISAYPSEVTPQMVRNFLAGGAAINGIAAVCEAEIYVLDAGVRGELPAHPGLIRAKLRQGSGNIVLEPAMFRSQAEEALQAGMDTARRAICEGATILAAGDMGIGNTTAAAALTAALLGLEAKDVTGRGTGVDERGYRRKLEAVRASVSRAKNALGDLTQADAVEVLAHLGGLEIAAIVGVFLAGAEAGIPLVTDGFPVTSGALVACRIEPRVRDYLFAGHRSVEPGHSVQLEALGLRPLLELELRLGEGTGAVLSFPLLRAAAATLSMATFDEAGVSEG